MVKEDARRCQKCTYQWWAVEVKRTAKPRWNDDYGFPGMSPGNAAARVSRLAAKRAESTQSWERWAICSRCGSQAIKTVSPTKFVPTALAEESQLSPSSQLSRESDPAGQPALQVGSHVVIRQFGYRGLTGTVSKMSAKDVTVDLDAGSGSARWIPRDKVELI